MVIIFLICLVVGVLLYNARVLEFKRASTAASNLSSAITQDISRNLELYDLSIQGVIDGVNDPFVMAAPDRLRQMVLFDRAATAQYLGALLVLDPAGDTILDSRRLEPPKVNYADRDYFKWHAIHSNTGLFINGPLVSRSDGKMVIGLSRRITRPDGSFGGVVVGTLHLEYFHHLFSKLQLGPRGSLTIFRDDGTLVTREPYDSVQISKALKPKILLERLGTASEGEFQATSVVDGMERLYHFQRIGSLPLVLNVAISIDDIYADWWMKTLVITAIVLACCTIILAFAFGLRRELQRRASAEAALVEIAKMDSLTSIANRRLFMEVLEQEWYLAFLHRSPLSLLIIDVDHFKTYNDAFGHMAGDSALAALGVCLKAHQRGPRDLAARYGGEEFALILPSTDRNRALEIAEAVRQSVLDLSISHPQSDTDYLSISVGVATLVPAQGQPMAELVAQADAGLYESKNTGRNRSTVCHTRRHKAA
jgi:diguanylate cyclase (GGDEF)-like protein